MWLRHKLFCLWYFVSVCLSVFLFVSLVYLSCRAQYQLRFSLYLPGFFSSQIKYPNFGCPIRHSHKFVLIIVHVGMTQVLQLPVQTWLFFFSFLFFYLRLGQNNARYGIFFGQCPICSPILPVHFTLDLRQVNDQSSRNRQHDGLVTFR